MDITPKMIQLVQSLTNATAEGRIEWSRTFDETTFRVVLDKAAVRIESAENSYAIVITNEKGEVVDLAVAIEGEDEYQLFLKLYLLARRSAQKADDLIDDLIKNVNTRRTVK